MNFSLIRPQEAWDASQFPDLGRLDLCYSRNRRRVCGLMRGTGMKGYLQGSGQLSQIN